MRLIQREGKTANGGPLSAINRLIGGRERDEEEAAPTAIETARGIGGRFESISDQLDAATVTLQGLQALSGIIEGLRKPISDEYDERRAEHAELMGLRHTIAELRERFGGIDATATQLAAQVGRLEEAKAEAVTRAELAEQSVKEVAGELEVARVELAAAAARVAQLQVSGRDSEQSVRRLEEDAVRLRDELESSEQRRREADALNWWPANNSASCKSSSNRPLAKPPDWSGAWRKPKPCSAPNGSAARAWKRRCARPRTRFPRPSRPMRPGLKGLAWT